MKKLGLILLLVVVSFFLYLVWSYFASSTSDTLVVPAGQAGNSKSSPVDKDIKSLQSDFINSVKKNIDTAKSFVEQIPEAANNVFNDLVAQTKDTAREKLITILETTSSPASAPISANPGISGGISQNSPTEPNVCFIVSKGTLVGYGIDQPFPGMEETSYKIAWGDGETINGLFHSGDKNIIVSHSYARQGTYSIIFQLTSSSTTLTASRSVCVK
ncbi:MAG: hypothetical protein Q7K44_01685 [Candidatus Liptonbacteria bacterium]|nr:hypothetical protein [Candidatus Liptonbacteria bacterium]